MSSTSWWTMSSTTPAGAERGEEASPLSTHSEVGGWKWMPLGAGSQWRVTPRGVALGGCP